MVVCVYLVRFELVVAAGGREALLALGPAALAPEPGRAQLVGEVSPHAEGFGVRRGMRLGEALARCPELMLVPGDPVGCDDAWEAALEALEGIGAAVEPAPGRPGLACFEARGIERLHGGLRGVLGAAREALRGRVAAPRLGVGETRFIAVAAAARARARRAPQVVRSPRELAGEPVALLALRDELAGLPASLERLGIATLGRPGGAAA